MPVFVGAAAVAQVISPAASGICAGNVKTPMRSLPPRDAAPRRFTAKKM
jgi:hypothetical protein